MEFLKDFGPKKVKFHQWLKQKKFVPPLHFQGRHSSERAGGQPPQKSSRWSLEWVPFFFCIFASAHPGGDPQKKLACPGFNQSFSPSPPGRRRRWCASWSSSCCCYCPLWKEWTRRLTSHHLFPPSFIPSMETKLWQIAVMIATLKKYKRNFFKE